VRGCRNGKIEFCFRGERKTVISSPGVDERKSFGEKRVAAPREREHLKFRRG